jgi:hypothetical protein
MLKNKPISPYCGLTIILSNPSRLDNARLLTGEASRLVGMWCLQPEYNINMVEVRLAEDTSPFLPNTRCLLICGEAGMHSLLPETRGNTLNEMRGSVFYYRGLPTIPSYFPQDCTDLKNYEASHNPLSANYSPDDEHNENEDGESDSPEAAKRHSKTKRANYAFWLRADVRKCKTIIRDGAIPRTKEQPTYKTYSNSDEICKVLVERKNDWLYFDMETDWEEQNLQCFSFRFSDSPIYNVPVLNYNYHLAYASMSHIIRALAIAIRDNVLVAHNGACFDFFVLAAKYQIPIGRVYDTMVAGHRIFPDVEKSLGHMTSYWTWEKFHKDTDSQGYRTEAQMTARMHYCGKDVYTMYLIHKAIESYAPSIPGLSHSIATAMDSIVPYLTTTIQGIRVDQEAHSNLRQENDGLMGQYIRIINMLIGEIGLAQVKEAVKNSKAKSMAASNPQMVRYFHELLGYPIVARSRKTGEPSLGKNALYKLALKESNPVISTVCAYRATKKEIDSITFNPWKGDRNTCFYTSSKVKTFRQSSIGIFKDMSENSKSKSKWGANLQNIKKSIRAIYVPDNIDSPITTTV